MKDITFRVYHNGDPVTNLTQSDVKLKTVIGAITKSYSTFVNGGLGFYALLGVTSIAEYCNLYISDVVQPWFGSQLCGDEALLFATLAGANTFAGANAFSLPLTIADATGNNHAVSKGQLVTGLATKVGLTDNNTFTGDFNDFRAGLCLVKLAGSDFEAVPKYQMESEIAKITAPATSINIVRCMMSQTDLTGVRYDTLAKCFTYAKSVNASDRLMIISIDEVNVSTYLTLGTPMENYIKVRSKNKNWFINVTNYSYTSTQNLSCFENCTLYFSDSEAPQTFQLNGLRLDNVDLIGDGTLNLTNVVFGNGVRIISKVGGIGLTLNCNNCVGSSFESAVEPVITGTCPDYRKSEYLTM